METETAIAVLAPRGYRVNEDTLLRHVRFDGYDLLTWDANTRASTGQHQIGYALFAPGETDPIFHGADIGVSPMHAIDSDDALRGVLGFLLLRPGDTDAEFFANYTERQTTFADREAEPLQFWAMDVEDCEDTTVFENVVEY